MRMDIKAYKLDKDLQKLAEDFNLSGLIKISTGPRGQSMEITATLDSPILKEGDYFYNETLAEYFFPRRASYGRVKVFGKPVVPFLKAILPYLKKLEDFAMSEYVARAIRISEMVPGPQRKRELAILSRRNQMLYGRRSGRPKDWMSAIRHSKEARRILGRHLMRKVK